jgi:hypothetical protein
MKEGQPRLAIPPLMEKQAIEKAFEENLESFVVVQEGTRDCFPSFALSMIKFRTNPNWMRRCKGVR